MTGFIGAIFWLVVSIVMFVVESVTVQLVTIWFAFGALFALIASFLGAPFWLQLLVFLFSSIAVLVVGRPVLAQKIGPRKHATNADRVIGQIGIVLETIDNINQTGRVSANGLDWSARSYSGEVIPEKARVLVHQIDGVKLIVERLQEGEE